MTEYKSKFEDITFIRDGGEPRVYFFPAEVPDGDYRHIIPHELNGITVEGLFALLGTYGFFPSASR